MVHTHLRFWVYGPSTTRRSQDPDPNFYDMGPNGYVYVLRGIVRDAFAAHLPTQSSPEFSQLQDVSCQRRATGGPRSSPLHEKMLRTITGVCLSG